MGKAFAQGMVLVLSIWDDYAVNMLWLDSDYPTTSDPTSPGVARGSCSTSSGNPKDVESQSPGSTVVFSNIKYGPIGSTFNMPAGGNSPPPSSSTSKPPTSSSTTSVKPPSSSTTSTKPTTTTTTTKPTTTTTTTKPTTTTTSGGNCAAKWGQCGGQGWNGPTCCASGSTCKVSNPYYSQCL
jgi:cellulose 1,4-beta-cellobiosidase